MKRSLTLLCICSIGIMYWVSLKNTQKIMLSSQNHAQPTQLGKRALEPDATIQSKEKTTAIARLKMLDHLLQNEPLGLERLEGDSALDKEPKRPLHAEIKTISPSPRDASWKPGQTLNLGWQQAHLPENEGYVRIKLSMSAESAEGYRVAAALRPRVLKSLYFLLNHRASGALTLPDAETRLAHDLNERLARMSAGYALEVHIEGLEIYFE